MRTNRYIRFLVLGTFATLLLADPPDWVDTPTAYEHTASMVAVVTHSLTGEQLEDTNDILTIASKLNISRGNTGEVLTKQEDGKYNGVLSHVNNFLPFLDGPNKIEFDKPIKRKYTRRTVKRGKTL